MVRNRAYWELQSHTACLARHMVFFLKTELYILGFVNGHRELSVNNLLQLFAPFNRSSMRLSVMHDLSGLIFLTRLLSSTAYFTHTLNINFKKAKHFCDRKWHSSFIEFFRARLVHVFKNWKFLFENFCEKTCGWKSVLKYVKCCLKTENCCLKTLTKHPLSLW